MLLFGHFSVERLARLIERTGEFCNSYERLENSTAAQSPYAAVAKWTL
jgi:hypothetical protein